MFFMARFVACGGAMKLPQLEANRSRHRNSAEIDPEPTSLPR
jgi:hypothetical protein